MQIYAMNYYNDYLIIFNEYLI